VFTPKLHTEVMTNSFTDCVYIFEIFYDSEYTFTKWYVVLNILSHIQTYIITTFLLSVRPRA